MKKQIVILLIGLAVMINAQIAIPPPLGTGTESDPYQIATLENLYWIAADSTNWDKHYIQTADIDASETRNWFDGKGWKPIGETSNPYDNPSLSFSYGKYNGQFHKISGLYINRENEALVGLFASVYNSDIMNLILHDITLTGRQKVGAITGSCNNSTISNCFVSGKVTGTLYANHACTGGLIGYSNANNIQSCSNSAEISSIWYSGGLIGETTDSNVSDCYSTGFVSGYNISKTGGLIGYLYSNNVISNCYSYGKLDPPGSGGLIGKKYYDNSDIFNCYWNTETANTILSDGGVGLTTPVMQDTLSFSGWNFSSKWDINTTNNLGFPFLKTQVFNTNPSVITWGVKSISHSEASVKYLLTDVGDSDIIRYGICWNTIGNPTISDNITDEGSSANARIFESVMTSLVYDQTYYIKSYAENLQGIVYGNEIIIHMIHPVGIGSEGDPYQIATLNNLYWITTDTLNFDKHYIQTADINAADTKNWYYGKGWTPIGNIENPFTGSFDGQTHFIDSLFCQNSGLDLIGLFGYLYTTSFFEIKNVNLTNIDINGGYRTGGLVGESVGYKFSNCSVSGQVSNLRNVYGEFIGGVIGQASGCEITKCRNNSNVTGGSNSTTGGLIGGTNVTNVIQCFNTGFVSSSNTTGGLIGSLSGASCSVNNSYNAGKVYGVDNTAGLIGTLIDTEVYNCYSTGEVAGWFKSGLIGSCSTGASVSNSFWDIEISKIDSSSAGVGLSTVEMQTLSTLTDAGWDFIGETTNGSEDIWNINTLNNSGYPFLSWQTFSSDPEVSVLSIEHHTTTSSSVNCYINNVGDTVISAYGVCWNMTGNPTISDNITDEGTATSIGSYTSEITSLSASTSYYLKAYATSSTGTIYSDVFEFITYAIYPITPNGQGTLEDPYQIASLENLYWIAADTLNYHYSYIQTADINAAETRSWFVGDHDDDPVTPDEPMGWKPIGNFSEENFAGIFDGSYDGKGHIIDSLYINHIPLSFEESMSGLFGKARNAVVKNLGITNCTITGGIDVGILCGWFEDGIIENCYTTGTVSGGVYAAGGLVGEGSENIEKCYSTAAVTGHTYVGGLIGFGFSVNASFWDTETSGVTTSDGGTGLTTAEMKTKQTFLDAGWDFVGESNNGTEDIWDMDGVTNDGYPFLAWMSTTGIEEDDVLQPVEFTLSQNYPNPFNPVTTIKFSIPTDQNVKLSVFNSNGQLVNELINKKLDAGNHSVQFNAERLNSGIYFYRLESAGKSIVNKMLLIK